MSLSILLPVVTKGPAALGKIIFFLVKKYRKKVMERNINDQIFNQSFGNSGFYLILFSMKNFISIVILYQIGWNKINGWDFVDYNEYAQIYLDLSEMCVFRCCFSPLIWYIFSFHFYFSARILCKPIISLLNISSKNIL